MTTVIAAGVAVIDFIFLLDEVPHRAHKYRARDAMIVGGGCAANAAVAVSRLGGHAVLATRLGDDMIGDMILAGLEEEGVDCSLSHRFKGGRSSFSSVTIDADGERSIIGFRDETMDFSGDWLEQKKMPEFGAALADTRWPAGARILMEQARHHGVPGIIDGEAPVREAQEALDIASHIAFSTQGLQDYCGSDSVDAGLRQAGRETGAWVCVTDGENGVRWLDGTAIKHMPAFSVVTVDTLGAGDVWHGAFALMLAKGASELEAIRYASAVSAIKCTQFGGRAGIPTAEAVDTFLEENS
jgi:sulfofructose kinase